MANEFFRAFGPDAAISITPGSNGRIEVRLDGELIYDKKAEGNTFPELGRIREMKKVIQAKLDSITAAAAD
jgi:predicted Rdx family selenoprotein